MISVTETGIEGVLEIRPERFSDERGFFSEIWNEAEWREAGIALTFVQDNHSLSRSAGVLRGLHFQRPPEAQDKVVRVTCGSVFDVAVDIRRSSPTYRRWVGVTLSSQAWNQLLIPRGFAHGFITLEPDTEVQYKVTAPYSPEHERCVRFDDPAIGVDWPVDRDRLTLSDKDRAAPLLADVDTGF
jgi:dTDP-4-dehydrorhamnose 3,5-epimerase